ncbi:hypothetical protein QLQ12_43025, partial [Actinoplanes sp. NEAU-A12]|nr:hypothetical protein [Actinoplanes sandaracinus]
TPPPPRRRLRGPPVQRPGVTAGLEVGGVVPAAPGLVGTVPASAVGAGPDRDRPVGVDAGDADGPAVVVPDPVGDAAPDSVGDAAPDFVGDAEGPEDGVTTAGPPGTTGSGSPEPGTRMTPSATAAIAAATGTGSHRHQRGRTRDTATVGGTPNRSRSCVI